MWGAIIGAVVAIVGMIIDSENNKKDRQASKDLAEFQATKNEEYLDKQNQYNSPQQQIKRFQEAGLNPNLIYGQGSPGNQTAALSYPDIKQVLRPRYGDRISQMPQDVNQSLLVQSQVQAQNATTRQKHALTSLAELQAQVVKKNPLLDDAGFKATIDGLKAAAELKSEEVTGKRIQNTLDDRMQGWKVIKVTKEVDLLEQRFKLGELDAKLKAEVLKSKEFQNAILEVQKKFMADGDVGPSQILQFVQLLLMKAL